VSARPWSGPVGQGQLAALEEAYSDTCPRPGRDAWRGLLGVRSGRGRPSFRCQRLLGWIPVWCLGLASQAS